MESVLKQASKIKIGDMVVEDHRINYEIKEITKGEIQFGAKEDGTKEAFYFTFTNGQGDGWFSPDDMILVQNGIKKAS